MGNFIGFMGNKIGILGYYGKGNKGDNLFQQKFTEIFYPYGDVTVFSADSPEIKEQDVIVVGGGSLINDKFFYFKNPNLAAKHIFLNVNITQYNDGIPARFPDAMWVVRDLESLKYCPVATYCPDILLTHKFESLPPKRKIAVVCNHFCQKDLFSKDSALKTRAEYKAQELVDFCAWMGDFGWETAWVAMQEAPEVKDSVFSSYLFGLNNFRGEIGGIEVARDARILLSYRFHGSVIAITQGKRFLNLNSDDKCVNGLKSYGFDQWVPTTKKEMITLVNSLENTQNFEEKSSLIVKKAVNSWREIILKVEKFLL